jgi:hypothetical protein
MTFVHSVMMLLHLDLCKPYLLIIVDLLLKWNVPVATPHARSYSGQYMIVS